MVTEVKMESLMERQEAADALRICVRSLQKLFRGGELPYVTIGRRVMVDPADLRRYIQSRKTGAAHGITD